MSTLAKASVRFVISAPLFAQSPCFLPVTLNLGKTKPKLIHNVWQKTKSTAAFVTKAVRPWQSRFDTPSAARQHRVLQQTYVMDVEPVWRFAQRRASQLHDPIGVNDEPE
jgi:hypothetical protein